MSRYVRLIPRLDIKGPNLVKGISLEGLRVLGDPDLFAQVYTDQGADELSYVDVVASLYERNSLHEMVSRMAKNIFIPITVGGGLRTIDDIQKVLDHGADKISINTAAIKNPNLIQQASRKFGSSTIVATLEVIKQSNGTYLCFTDNGREHTGVEAIAWAKKVEELGAGELVVTSVDREGSGNGYDIELLKQICAVTSIPVVAHGGAGSFEDIKNVIQQTEVNGVCFASILHYDTIHKIKSFRSESNQEGNYSFLAQARQFAKIKPLSLESIVQQLKPFGITSRAT